MSKKRQRPLLEGEGSSDNKNTEYPHHLKDPHYRHLNKLLESPSNYAGHAIERAL